MAHANRFEMERALPFAMIYLDDAGNLWVEESLRTHQAFFTSELRARFLQLVAVGYQQGCQQTIPLVIGNQAEVKSFYVTAFKNFQQLNCRVMAKEFIKCIEPSKQAKHPYCGKEKTKPNWWPSEVKHKEPDHLLKDSKTDTNPRYLVGKAVAEKWLERVCLMVYILMNRIVTADKL